MSEKQKLYDLVAHLNEQIHRGQYSNALAVTHDLSRELHRLWANVVRYEMKLKSQEEKAVDAELLAACKAALEDGGDYKLSVTVKDRLRAVIALAEGDA